MAARRAASATSAPGIESSWLPAASASPSSPGCGRSCAAARRRRSASEFKGARRAPTSPARRSTATGITPADGPCRTCTCSTSPAAASSTCSGARTGSSPCARRAGRPLLRRLARRTRIVFAHDPGPEAPGQLRALAEIELRTRRVATVAHDRLGPERPPLQPGRRAHRLPSPPTRAAAHHAQPARRAGTRRALEGGERPRGTTRCTPRCAGTTTARA